MSAFDASVFMGQVTEEAGDTSYVPVPEGEVRLTFSDKESDFKPRVLDSGQVVLEATCNVEDDKIKKELNMDNPRVKASAWLDLDSTGKLAWGPNQNITLGQWREAVGQNKKGESWSPQKLLGAGPFMGLITHRADKNDPTRVFAEVKKVWPIQGRRG